MRIRIVSLSDERLMIDGGVKLSTMEEVTGKIIIPDDSEEPIFGIVSGTRDDIVRLAVSGIFVVKILDDPPFLLQQ